MQTICQVNKIDFNFTFQNSFPTPSPPPPPPHPPKQMLQIFLKVAPKRENWAVSVRELSPSIRLFREGFTEKGTRQSRRILWVVLSSLFLEDIWKNGTRGHCRVHIFFRQPFSKWLYLPRVYSRNWLMRVKWAPFCNFRGPFFKKGGPGKGAPNPKNWVLFETFHILYGSDSLSSGTP